MVWRDLADGSGRNMARKARDYAAEQRRRNELARERGFSSRAQQRRAIEKGSFAALAPNRIRNPKTREAQSHVTARPSQAGKQSAATRRESAGFRSDYQYRKVRDENFDYSAAHAHRSIAMYDPDGNAPGVDRYVYAMAYYRAFVSGPERYGAVRRTGGSDALRHYFVDITHYYTADEYETRYGHDTPIRRR